jgi:hypothetical protein
MVIKTEKYEWAHGTKPRGYGMWAFEVCGNVGMGYNFETMYVTGKYAAARAEAVRQYKGLYGGTVVSVEVQP